MIRTDEVARAMQTSQVPARAAEVTHGSHPVLVHYHIFKNAGSSFEWALEKAFGERFRRFDSPSAGGFVTSSQLASFIGEHPDVSAVSSHQAAPPSPVIENREVYSSILIRDPIARIRSIYAFERLQEAGNPGAVKAKELDFKGYVEWRLKTSPAMLCNFQVGFCSRGNQGQLRTIGQAELERAIANLDRLSIVGTVARYDDWLRLAEGILSPAFGGLKLGLTRQNVTSGGDNSKSAMVKSLVAELGETMTLFLIENNKLDMQLHQVADALLTRRLAESGLGVAMFEDYMATPPVSSLSSAGL